MQQNTTPGFGESILVARYEGKGRQWQVLNTGKAGGDIEGPKE